MKDWEDAKISSKESPGIFAENFTCLSTRIINLAIQRGIKEGTKVAMEFLKEQEKAQRKGRYDRRLRNTRLLLKNYRVLKIHVQNSVFNAKKARENAIDILDGLDDCFDDDLYIESIKKSQQRTLIILNHVDEMLKYYRIYCEQSGKDEEIRRYKIIVAMYVDDEKKSAQEISEKFHVERRTIYKDINAAIKPLSSLIFGIDSLKIY